MILQGIVLTLLIIKSVYSTAQQVEFCKEYQLVVDFYKPTQYISVCVECEPNYVLSFGLNQCLVPSENNFNPFFCKRRGRNQMCEEALCTIQLDENGSYLSKNEGHSNDNCARVDKRTGECLYPRFNYSLDKKKQTIIKDTTTYCAIREDNSCIEYFSAFIPATNKQVTFLSNFANPEKIVNTQSLDKIITCLDGYEILMQENSNEIYYGCVLTNYFIENCQQYDIYQRVCSSCIEGFSLSWDLKECIRFQNCLRHQANGCVLCKEFYQPYEGKCVKLENCIKQLSIIYQQMCIYCRAPYYGRYCEQINNDVTEECEMLNLNGICVKCKDSENKFYHLINSQCEPRVQSTRCKYKNPISDYCENFECNEGYVLNVEYSRQIQRRYKTEMEFDYYTSCQQWEYYFLVRSYQTFDINGIYCDDQMGRIVDNYYEILNEGSSIQSQPFCFERIVIEGCIEYDHCFQSCLKCQQGLKLKQRDDILTQFYFRFICVYDPPITIQHCLQQADDAIQCIKCEDYYTSIKDECKLGTVNNCFQYGYSNFCIECEENYVLYYNQCFYAELCSEYILQFNNLYCTECIQKPGVVITLVQSSNNLRSDCVQNLPTNMCAFVIDDICMQCSKGYVLVEATNNCIQESEVVDDCFKANNLIQCISCNSGFSLVHGKCLKISGSCSLRQTCSDSDCEINCLGIGGSCQYNCSDDQLYDGQICIQCSDYYNSNCGKCTLNKCQTCNNGSVLSFKNYNGGYCVFLCEDGSESYNKQDCPCIAENCFVCNSFDKNSCEICVAEKSLQDKKCIDKCSEGYNVYEFNIDTFVTNICFKCQDNCNQCNYGFQTNPIICIECKEGYYLEDGECVLKCSKYKYSYNRGCFDNCYRFLLDENTCVEKCPYFAYYSNEVYSIIALSGNGICVERCLENQYQYEDINLCSKQCNYGYYQDNLNKRCIKCKVEQCYNCSQSSESCNYCNHEYYLKDGKCQYICPNLTLSVAPQACPQCGQYCLSCNNENSCTKCEENMVVDQDGKCQCEIKNGYFISYPNQCIKCEIENCFQCKGYSEIMSCEKCQTGYYLIQNQETGLYSCISHCPNGLIGIDGRCRSCFKNCLECSQNGCQKCLDGYTPMAVFYSAAQCVFQCPDGTKTLDLANCGCLIPNCVLCNKDMLLCDVCEYSYTNHQNRCEPSAIVQCGENCQECDGVEVCKICIPGYQPLNGKCYYKCSNGDYMTDYTKCNSSTLCLISNCYQCDQTNPNKCVVCQSTYFLVNFQCYTTCPDGFFKDSMNICQPCNPLCLTCSSIDKCDTCKNNSSLQSTECFCPLGKKLFKNQCLEKCPFHSTQIGEYLLNHFSINKQNFCIENCVDGLYPVFTANREQRICQKVEDFNSAFCLQNIENIPEQLSFTMKDIVQKEPNYYITITISQTPSICYDFILLGQSDHTFSTELIKEDIEYSTYQAIIPNDAIEKKLLDCTDFKCTVALNIFYIQQLQYIVLLTLDFDITIILNNGFNYQGSKAMVVGVCPTCIIPSSLIIPSSVQIKCSDQENCYNNIISTTTNSQITIIQTVDEQIFFSNKLQPHSIKLEHTLANGSKNTLFITNYFYDNSVIGQITYTFKAISLKSGNLIITSICKSAKRTNGRILSSNSSDDVVYPQIQLAFQMIDDQILQNSSQSNKDQVQKDSENEQEFSLFYILILCFSLVFILFIVFIAYRCYMKKQRKLISEKYKESQNAIKEDHESQNKQLNNEKSLNIDLSLQHQTFDVKN